MLAPGSPIGRYVVKRRLAEGGMAEVYLAQATGPEGFSKDVVIKVVRSFLSSDQQFIDMFVAEARLSSRLNHANVVQIFDFGKHEQSYFIAMEYVRGASLFDLRRRCREEGVPFPPTLAAEIGAQVARGLQYAHSVTEKGRPLGIVHRDVTPHNVLLSFEGAVKLTDFGIAKASTSHTAPGVLKGKFAYMAPEQARGDAVDARTDVFALGVVLWELLTGGRLFDGDSELAVLRAVQESLIAPPSRLNPDVPNELSDIVLRALARSAGERFQSAFELEKALATFVLRAAKSIEDTSVSLFLQQLYRAELENDERSVVTPMPLPPASRGVVPQASSFGSGDTLSVDRSAELARPAFEVTQPREALRTESMRREPVETTPGAHGRTDQMPAHRPSQPLRSASTDESPAHQPSASIAAGGTDVVQRGDQKRTDPAQQPLEAEPATPSLDNSSVRLSDSMRLDAQRRVEERHERVANDPTVLKPRSIALDLRHDEPTPATAGMPPAPRQSTGVLVAGALIVVALVGLGGFLVFRDPSIPEPVDAVATPASAPAPSAPPLDGEAARRPLELARVDEPAVAKPPVAKPPEPAPVVAPPPPEAPAAPALEVDPKPVDPRPVGLRPVAEAKPVEAKPVLDAKPVEAKPVLDAKPIEPKAATRFGLVSIRAIPFAEVLVNGRKASEVQGTGKLKLPYGKHRLVLRHPKREEAFDVVVDGKPAEVSFTVGR